MKSVFYMLLPRVTMACLVSLGLVKGSLGQQPTSNATGATHHHLQQAQCHQRIQVSHTPVLLAQPSA